MGLSDYFEKQDMRTRAGGCGSHWRRDPEMDSRFKSRLPISHQDRRRAHGSRFSVLPGCLLATGHSGQGNRKTCILEAFGKGVEQFLGM